MKTSVKSMFLLALLFLIPNYVKAASSCSYSEQAELNEIVSHVNANYEIVEVYKGTSLDVDNPNEDGTFPRVDKYSKEFKISIFNITDDIYVKVSNSDDGEIKTFRYSDTQDGIAVFQTSKKYELVTYKVEVYSNKYSCAGEKFREFTFMTPMYNYYSKEKPCEGNSDFYYCQEFITSETITTSEFLTKIKEYEEQKKNEEEQKKQEEIGRAHV